MTTEEKIAHNKQVEQERAAYHKRRCEESDAYKRVYERVIGIVTNDAMQAQSVVNAVQTCCQQQVVCQMPNITEQPLKSYEEAISEREAIKEYELYGNPNGVYYMFIMWLKLKMTEDKKLRNDLFFDLQALKEICEVEQTYNRQLERFDKYEL